MHCGALRRMARSSASSRRRVRSASHFGRSRLRPLRPIKILTRGTCSLIIASKVPRDSRRKPVATPMTEIVRLVNIISLTIEQHAYAAIGHATRANTDTL